MAEAPPADPAAPAPGSVPATISREAGLAAIAAGLPSVRSATVQLGEVVLHTDTDWLIDVMTALKEDPRFSFEQVMDICGVDWPSKAERFEVVYNLLSVSHNHRIRVIVTTDGVTPVPSVSGLWAAATWWEREAWDLYGIPFSGQPDLRRILTDYGFVGHPMRKDFPMTGYVEVRYDEERKQVIYEPVKLTQDFRRFDFISPWEGMTTLPGDEKAHREG